MPRARRLHPEYETDEDGKPTAPDPADNDDGSSLLAWLAEPVPPSPRGGRGAPEHPAKAWFMERGFFALDALGLDHKGLTPVFRQVTGATSREIPSARTVSRWWAEWNRKSLTDGQRGAPPSPARAWYMTTGFQAQEVRGWTDRQLEVEHLATGHMPPHPSARSLRRWKREWRARQKQAQAS